MRISNKTLLDLDTVTASDESEVVGVDFLYGLSLHIIWTSVTASASITIQASNDEESWNTISAYTQTISNNNGNVLINTGDVFYKYLKVVVTYTSGTVDTLKVIFNAKGI